VIFSQRGGYKVGEVDEVCAMGCGEELYMRTDLFSVRI
jgi:hypothetical protein